MDKLEREIPDYMIMPYRILEASLLVLDSGLKGYADGKDKRRSRREQERKTRFRGQNEAGRLTGVSGANISQVCDLKRKTAGGFIWRYEV